MDTSGSISSGKVLGAMVELAASQTKLTAQATSVWGQDWEKQFDFACSSAQSSRNAKYCEALNLALSGMTECIGGTVQGACSVNAANEMTKQSQEMEEVNNAAKMPNPAKLPSTQMKLTKSEDAAMGTHDKPEFEGIELREVGGTGESAETVEMDNKTTNRAMTEEQKADAKNDIEKKYAGEIGKWNGISSAAYVWTQGVSGLVKAPCSLWQGNFDANATVDHSCSDSEGSASQAAQGVIQAIAGTRHAEEDLVKAVMAAIQASVPA